MNLVFTDIRNPILKGVQADIPQRTMMGSKDKGFSNESFEQQFGQVMNKARSFQEQRLPAKNSANNLNTIPENPEKLVDLISEQLNDKKGVALVSELKNTFMLLSKGDLSKITIDSEGLDALKKILIDAGFDADELDKMLAELTEGLEEDKLALDELFANLFDLPLETAQEVETTPEQFFEISDLPFLESILNALDLPDETVQEILTAADKGDRGFSLDVIIEKLQMVQKKAFYNNESFQVQADDKRFQSIINQLGIQTQDSKDAVFTLNDLVESFENMRNKLKVKNQDDRLETPFKTVENIPARQVENSKTTAFNLTGNQKFAEDLKSLFKGLENQSPVSEKAAVEFSQDGIKNQFETDLLVPKKGETLSKGLFAMPKEAPVVNNQLIKDGLKELVAQLDKNGTPTSMLKESAQSGKELAKDLKARVMAQADQAQDILADAKASDAFASRKTLRSQATFKNLPNFVTQQVSKSIVRAINQGENSLKIQLNPPELGRLNITIDNSGNTMRVNIVTDNVHTREILISNVSELRSVLSNSGVHLEQFDVDMNSDFKQSMADAKGQAGNFNKRQQNTEKTSSDAASDGLNESHDLNLTEAIDQGESLHFVA